MRTELLAAIALLACGAGATFETGTARPGGAYQSMPMNDAEACATACDQDGLCIAWSFSNETCELKAVAPAPIADASVTSGLSARAPTFVRLITPPPAPELRARGQEPAPTAAAPASARPTAAHQGDVELLGGPEPAPHS